MDSPHAEIGSANEVGLIANANAGPWDIALDETLSGEQKWFLQIEGPTAYLYLEIEGPDLLDRLLAFLDADPTSAGIASSSELDIASFGNARVLLIWDSESDRRCIVLIQASGASVLRLTLSAADISNLIVALDQIRNELRTSGLLPDSRAE